MESSTEASTASRKKGFGFQPGNPGGVVGNSGRGSKVFSLEHQEKFLRLYAKIGVVRIAAKKCGFRDTTIYNQCHSSKRFHEAFLKAREKSISKLEDNLTEIAFTGECEGDRKRNLLAMFAVLKARRPDVWRENAKVTLDAEGSMKDFFAGFAAIMPKADNMPLKNITPGQKTLEHAE